jgi:DNA adenine methylase
MTKIENVLEQEIKQPTADPILKWAGGKQQLWSEISRHIPDNFGKYIEPFLGGGAIFFGLAPSEAIISDSNPELINFYKIVRDDLNSLIELVSSYENNEQFYYKIRGLKTSDLSQLERAARILYLNKTCFNGLYRVNKKGEFNVPFAGYKNPTICDKEKLKKANEILQGKEILCSDYKEILLDNAESGDLVFLDPPYLSISDTADFKRYTKEFFYKNDHKELSQIFGELYNRGCTLILTNSNHPLVYDLYKEYKIEIHQTKRNINSNGNKRNGQDIIVVGSQPSQNFSLRNKNAQLEKFPGTRFMGSKASLIDDLWYIAKQYSFETVFDAFSGSGIVSYMFKSNNKEVYSNDYMTFAYYIAKSLIENKKYKLDDDDIEFLLEPGDGDGFVPETFDGIYFTHDENVFLDDVRARINKLYYNDKKALAIAALCRACLKRQPRGIFTFVGHRYDDGRKDLRKDIKQHFLEAVNDFNKAVFDNGKNNIATNQDTMKKRKTADLVYIDPPYYSTYSDNIYSRRYHFVEGLAKEWKGLEIQKNTKTKKFKNYESPFLKKDTVYEAFDKLFYKHRKSILMVSNSLPKLQEMVEIMSRYKDHIEIYKIDHLYSFGNQGHKVNDNNNSVKEYIFVGY